jgi:hypothetical protein
MLMPLMSREDGCGAQIWQRVHGLSIARKKMGAAVDAAEIFRQITSEHFRV